jgi:quinol monooxygenase YgiN
MYVNLSIMRPNADFADQTRDSMHRFAATARAQPGCIACATLADGESSSLYGLAVWESEDAAHAAGPALNAAVADDDFESWLAGMDHHTLTEV